jgi:lysophospholipase L1-like esterase
MKKMLSLGDCNTLGIKDSINNAYPEQIEKYSDFIVTNCGFTMSTTKEGIKFFDEFNDKYTSSITIQYGLVDSWKTFKYSPYILYYPDNIMRKISRKLIKKYKKISKKLGLNDLFGVKSVVCKDEYLENLLYIIKNSRNKKIFLIDTIPNKDLSRNNEIKEYNSILEKLSLRYSNCFYISIYDYFYKNMDSLYIDETHMNNLGHKYIAEKILKELI